MGDFVGIIFMLFVALVILAYLSMPFIFGFKVIQTLFHPTWKKLRFTSYPNQNPKGFQLYSNLLSEKFNYYLLLTDTERIKFVDRLRYIRNQKSFVGRGLTVTEEMEIMISATLTQLTFGLEQFDLEDLTEIHITPEAFYAGMVGRNVKGLTFESGRMILSWADYVTGYSNNDGVNLGLHEMAHALMLDHFAGEEMEQHYNDWHTAALAELQRQRSPDEHPFLRNYAFTNIEEFWACSVESFFELPVQFKQNIPVLYTKVKDTLNQDMATRMAAATL